MMTEKQIQFCENYLANGFKPQQAYFDAFPEADKNNRHPSYPYTLMAKQEIKEYIQKRRQEMFDSCNVDAMRITQEIANMAFAQEGDPEYSPSNKLKALEMLQKQFGLQNQNLNVKQEVIEISLED